MSIFILLENEEYGPFSLDEISTCLLRGDFANDVLARTENPEEWRPLHELLAFLAVAPDPSGENSESTMDSDFSAAPAVAGFLEDIGDADVDDELPVNEEPDEAVPSHTEFKAAPTESGDLGGILVWRDNELFGPYSWDDIFLALLNGELINEDRARREGESDWHSLGEMLSAEMGMVFPHIEAQAAPPSRITAPRSRIPLIKSNSRTILVAGILGITLGFAATCFVLMVKRAPISTTVVKETAGALLTKTDTSPLPSTATPGHTASQGRSSPTRIAEMGSREISDKPATSDSSPAVDTSPARQVQKATVSAMSSVSAAPEPPSTQSESERLPLYAQKIPPVAAARVIANATPNAESPSANPGVLQPWRITFPKTAGIDPNSSLWAVKTSAKPRAILLLCLDTAEYPPDTIANLAWQKFAQDNQLALTAVTFISDYKVLEQGGGYYLVEKGSGDLIISALKKTFGGTLPIILYGRGGGGIFATNFASWRPDLLVTWAAYTGRWPKETKPEKVPLPALIVSNRGSLKDGGAAQTYYAAGRAEGKPWALISLAGTPDQCRKDMDAFFRQYVSALLALESTPGKPGVWTDIQTARTLTSLDIMVNQAKSAWLPSQEVQQTWFALIQKFHGTTEPKIVQRKEQTLDPTQPGMHLFLRLPPGAPDGKSVSGVLTYCSWQNNDSIILRDLGMGAQGYDIIVAPLLRFADDHNLAVITWDTLDTEDTWDYSKDAEDVDPHKQERLDKKFKLLADAWARGIAGFGHDTGIPQKDFLLYGISRGAQWAQRLAIYDSNYFLAVHVHIPSTFGTPTPDANGPLWLVTTGEEEYGYEGAIRFYHECHALGYPIIFKPIENLAHEESPIERSLGLKFFEYALSVKTAREAWEAAANDPFYKLRSKATSTGPWLESFRSPAYYGDFLNQECYPAQQAEMIPVALRVPLPTKELADYWNR